MVISLAMAAVSYFLSLEYSVLMGMEKGRAALCPVRVCGEPMLGGGKENEEVIGWDREIHMRAEARRERENC